MEPASGHSQDAAIVSQRAGPTAAEWENVKHIVRRLYVEEKRPLRDVAVILSQDFGFHATYVSHHFEAIVQRLSEAQATDVQRPNPCVGVQQEY
jgi:protein-disulfide isomerase-like protein with CxxC motif